MCIKQRCVVQSSGTRNRASFRGTPGRPAWAYLATLGLVLAATRGICSELPVGTTFPELTDVTRPLDKLLAGGAIRVGRDAPAVADDGPRAWSPFVADSRILAYEEHGQFLFACSDATNVLRGGQPTTAAPGGPRLIRRFLFLKPGVFVIDDLVRPTAVEGVVRWTLGCRSQPQVAGRQLRLSADGQELVCETLWPADKGLQVAGEKRPPDAKVVPFAVEQPAATGRVRFLHVLQLRKTGDNAAAPRPALEAKDGQFDLTISTSERTFRLQLPAPGANAGWIAIDDANGKAILPRRPLASGILPHGAEGMKLLDRWDAAYREGRRAPWDTGAPAPELKRVVEEGLVRPCRTVELGCGTGESTIYLAQKGFEVTAIDVAPTALGLAAEKAARAGVRVRWVLADVLALPELPTFDLVFDRGCYHNVRYVNAPGFVGSLRGLSHAGTRCLILSLNRDSPPGVREQTMRDDFSAWYDFEWLRDSGVEDRDGKVRRESWSLMLRRKPGP
jgi:SAM-dependent methyltransferase